VSLAPTNPSHRVNRRKSVNAAASSTAQAAIVAALREQGDAPAMPSHTHRRSVGSRKMTESQSMSARPSMHSYFNGPSGSSTHDVLEDDPLDEDMPPSSSKGVSISTKSRRRASEGSHLIKGDGKKSAAELRCETCGKGYKHSSCLTKHK